MKISIKEYKCTSCNTIKKMQTNHHGSFRCKCGNTMVCQTEKGIDIHEKKKLELMEWRKPLPKSKLNRNREIITFKSELVECDITWDDYCGNGHNSFHVTGRVFDEHGVCSLSGCVHDEIISAFPEHAHLIKWHGWTSDGYLYKGENVIYFAKNGNLKAARKEAVWEDGSLQELMDPVKLKERLPMLLKQMKSDIEALGFTY